MNDPKLKRIAELKMELHRVKQQLKRANEEIKQLKGNKYD